MHSSVVLRRLVAVAAAGLVVLLLPTAPGQASAEPSTVETAVTARLLADAPGADAGDTRVTVTRGAGTGWAFGTAVLTAPALAGAYPQGWLFLAQSRNGRWSVALEGERGFAALARSAPVLRAQERKAFAGLGEVTPSYANGDYRTGMRLPFATGVSWYLTGGPHGSPVWDAIDMAGGDQVVRAARGGTAYTMCRGWLRVVHDRGYATDYYHLWSNINVNGAAVGAGAFLGYTGTDVTCGGSATGRHVHFGLRQNSNPVPIANHIIGKWTPYNGAAAYQGYALHGSRRVNVGGQLYNYGALGFTQGIVDTNGGTSLNKRSGPGTGYAVVGSVADGATVSIACSRYGTSHTGRFGTTSLWNKLTDGTWVSDAYLATGSNGPVNGWC
ncbi:MAG: peptidoglycan DD-metalloendopeptidase family protein [Micromonosporaceae bacterium]